MSEPKKTVFISCGQSLESERALGKRAAELVRNLTPFEGYFAENQSDLKGVTESILSRLYDSVGFIAIMHHRGTVSGLERTTTRASVWIEQEIAIAAFMGQILKRPLRIVSYYQQGIELEGVRQFILLNPKPFKNNEDVLEDLKTVLREWKTPLYQSLTPQQQEAIQRKLAVDHIFAWHPQLTIRVTNRSDLPISVKSASMWHGEKRLTSAMPSEGRKAVEIRANSGNTAIGFTTDEDAMLKLQSFGVVERHLPNYISIDDVDIQIRIEYEALGVEDECRETVRVRVQGNRQIESL
jgi:hypothetical protein